MHENRWIVKMLSAAIGLMILLALVFGARAFGGGNLTQARRIAARLQAAAIADPNPVAAPALGATASAPASGGSAAQAASSAVNTVKVPAGQQAPTATPRTGVAASASPGSAPAAAKGATTKSRSAAVATVAARRQPTSAEVGQAIIAVHSLIPFFTPTPADIAATGNQVCTALDQGQSFSQVKSAALDMVGAGSYAWMIPSSVPEIAIRTVVALYCPANASKLV